MLERYKGNPILTPRKENKWEAKAVFNAGAIYLNNKIHLIYRAMSENNISSLGYARLATDGHTLEERSKDPVYSPTEIYEIRTRETQYNVGCEDPRLTLIGEKIFMCYTVVNDLSEPRVALTSIKKEDFLTQRWNWQKPILITPLGVGDKNACVIPLGRKQYAFFHRVYSGIPKIGRPGIWIDVRSTLKEFQKDEYIWGNLCIQPRENSWDSKRIGIAGPPLKIKGGWLLIYHGVSEDDTYRLGAAILDRDDPRKVIRRVKKPILEPTLEGTEGHWQKTGQVPNAIFSCGQVIVEDKLLVYYGIADTSIGVASCSVSQLIKSLIKNQI